MHPEEVPTDMLCPGQVGYIACNMKESSEGMGISLLRYVSHIFHSAHIGDTLHRVGVPVPPMPGFKPSKAMVNIFTIMIVISNFRNRCMPVYFPSIAATSPNSKNQSRESVS